MKENTSSVVGFIVVALYKTSTTCHYCCSKEDFKVVDKHLARNLSSRTIYFPVASNHVKALGLRGASDVISAHSQASFRNKGQ